ncbi:MAG: DUF2183 domain-containing protein [Bacteroidota bacterium]|nr:DUF2183 domain-containing protein [Bacteroidota bacterium]
MKGFKKVLTGTLAGAEDKFDRVIYSVRKRLKLFGPIHVCAYRTFGSDETVFVRGRVMEDKGIKRSDDTHSRLENMRNMYKRFETDEIRKAKLKVHFQGEVYETFTDDEGYFEVQMKPVRQLPRDLRWHEAHVEITEAPVKNLGDIHTNAQVMLPPDDAEFGIISDLDDTVIESFATNKLKMFRTVFLNNARTRMPFEGVSAFYRALQAGPDEKGHNPIFYVSSSPWNLYDFLVDFLDVHGIPEGPIMLRDTGIDREKLGAHDHRAHKYVQIERILNTYPKLKFILIGDSGQKDPVIYQEVVQKFPGRILAVYIRDVKLPSRAQVVIGISETLKEGETPMLLVENTIKAAEHAIARGYIPASRLEAIKFAKEVDEAATDATVKPPETKDTSQKVKEDVKEQLKDEALKDTITGDAEKIDTDPKG